MSRLTATDRLILGSNYGQYVTYTTGNYFSSTSTNFAFSSPITVAAWIYPTSNSGEKPILGKYNFPSNQGFTFATLNGNVFFRTGNGSTHHTATSYQKMSLNTWYFVVGLRDASNIQIYVNLTLSGSSSVTGSISNSTNPFAIGAASDSLSNNFAGRIASPIICSSALSYSNIWALYAKGPNNYIVPSNTVGYFTFSNNNGTDSSASGNNLTLTGNVSYGTILNTDINRNSRSFATSRNYI